jgi:hypothetical protein
MKKLRVSLSSIEKISGITDLFPQETVPKLNLPAGNKPADSAEISNTAKALDQVDKFFDLGSSDRLDLKEMNQGEKKEFLKMLTGLLRRGVVGYEVLNVKGKPEKHFIETEIGDQRIKGAKLYKQKEE